MTGLQRICKAYGGMKFKGQNGETVEWVWDYKQDRARLKAEMDEEARAQSEREKWARVQGEMESKKQGDLF